jgi:Arc/MetJ family transcription regulator
MMCAMRLHVYLDDGLVEQLDREVGARGRSSFVEECVRAELERRQRWRSIWSAFEGPPIDDDGHPWDPEPAAYFHEERARESAARAARLRSAWSDDR